MKVGFTGAYCTANFGDWAILINNIADIAADEAVVFTYSSTFPHHAIRRYCENERVTCIEVKTKPIDNTGDPLTPFECISHLTNYEELAREIRTLDVLCISGGGYFDDNWCSRTEKFVKMIAPAIIAKQLGKKIVFTAHGIGPIVDMKESMRFLFRYLDGAEFAIRDDFCSKSYLLELGVKEEHIHLLPDDLLFINKSLVQTEAPAREKEKYVVIVIHNSMEYVRDNESLFISFAANIKKKYGLNIVFLPFDLVWYGYDQSILLHSKIPSSSVIKYEKFLPIETAYDIISKAELVITGRYHASIVAQQVSTPFLVVLGTSRWGRTYSYNKVYGSLQRMFHRLPFDESLFMALNWEEALDRIGMHMKEITIEQRRLFEHAITKDNLDRMKADRLRYINQMIRGL